MGCLNATFRKVSDFTASFARRGATLACSFAQKIGCAYSFVKQEYLACSFEKKQEMTCSFGAVCGVSKGEAPYGYEILWASDGALLTVDGGYLFVKKQQ